MTAMVTINSTSENPRSRRCTLDALRKQKQCGSTAVFIHIAKARLVFGCLWRISLHESKGGAVLHKYVTNRLIRHLCQGSHLDRSTALGKFAGLPIPN